MAASCASRIHAAHIVRGGLSNAAARACASERTASRNRLCEAFTRSVMSTEGRLSKAAALACPSLEAVTGEIVPAVFGITGVHARLSRAAACNWPSAGSPLGGAAYRGTAKVAVNERTIEVSSTRDFM